MDKKIENAVFKDSKKSVFRSMYITIAILTIVILIICAIMIIAVNKNKEKGKIEDFSEVNWDKDYSTKKVGEGDVENKVDTGAYIEDDFQEKVEDTAIHNYQVVISDISWYEAKAECERAGGYLVRINTAEEYRYIIDFLNTNGYTEIHFYLGGRRNYDGRDYYWIDENDTFIEECLNNPESWTNGYWYKNEPSYEDIGSDISGNIEENVMNLFYVKDSWYLNDSSEDMAYYYPEWLDGKVGYIIEFE